MYICIYIYTYIYTCTYINIYIYIDMCIYGVNPVSTYCAVVAVSACMLQRTRMCVCVSVCVRVFVFVCVCVLACAECPRMPYTQTQLELQLVFHHFAHNAVVSVCMGVNMCVHRVLEHADFCVRT